MPVYRFTRTLNALFVFRASNVWEIYQQFAQPYKNAYRREKTCMQLAPGVTLRESNEPPRRSWKRKTPISSYGKDVDQRGIAFLPIPSALLALGRHRETQKG